VVRGGLHAVSEKKISKTVSETERMKKTVHICAETAFFWFDLKQKVGELILSITFCPTTILENV
jgi:hypothetical protein